MHFVRKIYEIAGSVLRSTMFIMMMATLGYAVCTPAGFYTLKIMISMVIVLASVAGIVLASLGMYCVFKDDAHTKVSGVVTR